MIKLFSDNHPDSVAQQVLKCFVQSIFSFFFNSKLTKKKKKEKKYTYALSTHNMARRGLLCFKDSICSHCNPFLLLSVVYLNFTVTSTQDPHLKTLLTCNPELFLENVETNAKCNT